MLRALEKFRFILMLFLDPPKLYRCFAPDEEKELPARALKGGLDADLHPPDWLH